MKLSAISSKSIVTEAGCRERPVLFVNQFVNNNRIRSPLRGTAPGLFLIFAALAICAASAKASPVYPKGVWSSYGSSNQISTGVVNDLGVVGIGIPENWSEIETSDGVYDWAQLDNKIAQAKAAGFHHLGLGIVWSSADTPPWLVSELKAEGQTISLLDSGHPGTTYCEPIETCLYWNERYHSKRLALIAAAGEHYSADPDIVAVFASFANHNSQDWHIQ